eukprot:TRINITY_DN6079_c0_g1_i4.p1 TRINITY_DN6079_c0_g1~~TRINITY_DN6079_c0_g1_i4.p1  ORF type:complete len:131 (-),score=16.89 TRINITY_DN6079_c0_g1_i4:391-783(-)
MFREVQILLHGWETTPDLVTLIEENGGTVLQAIPESVDLHGCVVVCPLGIEMETVRGCSVVNVFWLHESLFSVCVQPTEYFPPVKWNAMNPSSLYLRNTELVSYMSEVFPNNFENVQQEQIETIVRFLSR